MTFDILVMQVFSGFSLFSVLVLMAIGLTIVFGLMGVINMAHGELMALGAYMTYLTAQVFERWLPGLMGAYFIVGIFVAFAVTFAFGYLLYEHGGTKLGEYYLPLSAGPHDFDKLIEKARDLQPSFIFATVVGRSMNHLYRAYAEAGLDPARMPIASLVTTETDIQEMGPALAAGHISAASYFQSVDTPLNRRVIEQYRERFGQHQVTDRCWESAYFQVHLLAKAMRQAEGEAVEDVLQAMRGLELDAPQGRVRVDPDNHHTALFSRIGRVNRDGQFDLLRESRQAIKPDPYAIAPGLNDWSSTPESNP